MCRGTPCALLLYYRQSCSNLFNTGMCDCSRCASTDICGCDQPPSRVDGESACNETVRQDDKISSNMTCTPRCPPGSLPTESVLTCNLGTSRLEPSPSFGCYDSEPTSAPDAVEFIDADPSPGQVSGIVSVSVEHNSRQSGTLSVQIYLGLDNSTPSSQVLLEHQVVENQREPLMAWLPQTAVDANSSVLLAYRANAYGLGSISAAVTIMDLVVTPPQPVVNMPFQVSVRSLGRVGPEPQLQLFKTRDCKNKVQANVFAQPANSDQAPSFKFNLTEPGLYYVCQCHSIDNCRAVGQTVVIRQAPEIMPHDPVVRGTPFNLEIHSRSFTWTERIFAVLQPGGCSQGLVAETPVSFVTPIVGHVGEWKNLLLQQHGNYTVCWAAGHCRPFGDACEATRYKYASEIGHFMILDCAVSCATCYGASDNCSSCTDPGMVPINGKCTNASAVVNTYVVEPLLEARSFQEIRAWDSIKHQMAARYQHTCDRYPPFDCRNMSRVIRVKNVADVGVLDPSTVLVAFGEDDRARFSSESETGVLRLDLETGRMSYACATCCSSPSIGFLVVCQSCRHSSCTVEEVLDCCG